MNLGSNYTLIHHFMQVSPGLWLRKCILAKNQYHANRDIQEYEVVPVHDEASHHGGI